MMGTWTNPFVRGTSRNKADKPIRNYLNTIQQSVLTMGSQNRAQKSVQSPVTIAANIIAQCALARVTGTDGFSKGLQIGERLTHFQEEFDGPRGLCQATVNILADNALLDIFDFYLNDNVPDGFQNIDEWHTLVHVCRRWRNVVFASPHRLNLRLLCRNDRPVREMLDSCPALPIVIDDDWIRTSGVGLDNIIAALKHPDRVCSIGLNDIPSPALEALAATMQVPFPELIRLDLWSSDGSAPVLPDSFMGGSTPHLQTLTLSSILFPALPSLLLSASDLVSLTLLRLPHSGYISPESMAACLSSLNMLQSLSLGFASPQSRPDQPSPPLQTRVVLPALTNLSFSGMTDYSEDLFARIDAPVLNKFSMSFFLDLVFYLPHFKQFIGRAKGLKPPKVARMRFDSRSIRLEFNQQHGSIVLKIRCHRIDWQVNSIALVCGQLSPLLSHIERLDFVADYFYFEPQGGEDVESTQILELFRPFTAIRSLHVSKSIVPLIVPALQELVEERATEVLPNPRDVFLGGSELLGTVPEAMQPFVATRQLSGQPVAVHDWEGFEAYL